MSEEFEEMERIPWAALAAGAPDPRRRLAIAVAGAVVLLVLLVIVGGSVLNSSNPPVDSGVLAAADSVTTTTRRQSVSTQPSPGVGELESPAPAAPLPVYSEADLMATAVDDEAQVAAMWAERFVRDYLTIDGDGSTALDVARLVTAELPAAPDGVTSFVEWVDGYAVTAIQPARYRVEVGYRLLTGSDGSYVRQSAAALAVVVDIDVDRTAAIAGFPEVIEMPGLRAIAAPELTDQIPEWVLEQVATDASAVLGGYREGSDWAGHRHERARSRCHQTTCSPCRGLIKRSCPGAVVFECSDESRHCAGSRRLRPLGRSPDLLEDHRVCRLAGDTGASHRLVCRVSRRHHRPTQILESGRQPRCRNSCPADGSRRPIGTELGHLHLGGQQRAYRRIESWLLHQSAAQRVAWRLDSAGTGSSRCNGWQSASRQPA